MGKRTRKRNKTQTSRAGRARVLQELVVVATADTAEEAKDFEKLLKNNDIPAIVKRQQDEFMDGKRYAVMVPEDTADEAHVVIESQDAYDDFYDFALEDENEDEFDGEIFEDDLN